MRFELIRCRVSTCREWLDFKVIDATGKETNKELEDALMATVSAHDENEADDGTELPNTPIKCEWHVGVFRRENTYDVSSPVQFLRLNTMS